MGRSFSQPATTSMYGSIEVREKGLILPEKLKLEQQVQS